MVDLGTLGVTSSQPVAVIDAGQIVGNSYIANNTVVHAALWLDTATVSIDIMPGPSPTA